MSMIRRNKRTKEDDDLKVALHECAHVVVAELEDFPYQFVTLRDATLPDGTKIKGCWAPPDNLKQMIEDAIEPEAESLLIKLATIVRASLWIDIEQSGFSEADAKARNAGDWQMFDLLLSVSVVPNTRRDGILQASKESFDKHRDRPGF